MPIDYRFPALRRRRSQLAVRISNQQEVIDAARLDDRSATAYALQIQDAQLEFDELDYAIEFFETYKPSGAARIPISQTVIAIAVLIWLATTLFTYFALVR